MPIGKGFWLHIPSKEIHRVYEHASALLAQPEKYGFQADDPLITGYNPTDKDARRGLFMAAIKLGWARIRYTQRTRTIELWNWDEEARAALIEFFARTKAWDDEQIEIHELEPMEAGQSARYWSASVAQIRTGSERGTSAGT